MWLQFFSQDFHFTVHLFAALVCLAVSWLYLDAWFNHKNRIGLMLWLGFGLLSLSFLAQSTVIEESALGSLGVSHFASASVTLLRLLGYIGIIISQLLDPLQAVPETHGIEEELKSGLAKKNGSTASGANNSSSKAPALMGALSTGVKCLLPVAGLGVAWLYWQRATKGLERHLKPVAWAFLFIGLSELVHLSNLLVHTQNPIVYTWVASFGPLWWLEQLLLLIGILLLGKWVWGYLTERFFSQLFMILVSSIVVVFLAVTVVFTSLLLRSSRQDIVANLHTAAQVLNYALTSKQAETASGAEQVAANSDILSAVETKNHNALNQLTSNYLASKKQASLIITDAYGEVLLRGENPSKWGDSLSGNNLIRRSLLGDSSNSISVSESVGIPTVELESSVPILDSENNVVGSVTTGIMLNQAFVNGIKAKTGLNSSVYGSDVIAATTLLAPDNVSHLTGVIEGSQTIKQQVLSKGNDYSGDLSLNHQSYLGSIIPLEDEDNVPVGMLSVVLPQSAILLSAGRSVELTFALTAVLIIISVMPAYLIAKSLTKQLNKH